MNWKKRTDLMAESNNWPLKLLRWFEQERRELPWREERTPYTTWLSEVMLQQTKVETVRPYFQHWLTRFPNPEAVAAASESEVLHAWQGLGYYNRARNFQRAMREVVSTYDGEIPADEKALRSLPGVGPYMAGAILSLAFGQAKPAVDGNVLRIFARLYGIETDVLAKETHAKVTELAQSVIPSERPGDFNEALMDLGATICIPRRPRCELCPLREDCVAYKTGRTEKLPLRIKKTEQPKRYVTVGVLRLEGRYLLHKRPTVGMLAGMWEFPSVETEKMRDGLPALAEHWRLQKIGACCWRHRHVFTHRIWEMRAYPVQAMESVTPYEGIQFFTPAQFLEIPMAGPHAKLAAQILKGE